MGSGDFQRENRKRGEKGKRRKEEGGNGGRRRGDVQQGKEEKIR